MQHLGRHRAGWLLGLPALVLLWGATVHWGEPRFENSLAAAADRVVETTGAIGSEPWLRVEARGRDLIAKGEAPAADMRDSALERLTEISGVRRVVSGIGIVQEASPFAWTATRAEQDRIALTGSRPVEIGRASLAGSLKADLPDTLILTDEAKAARGAPPDFLAAASYAVARLRQLARGAVATVKDTTLSFEGEAVGVAEYDALRTAFANPPQGYSIGHVDILPPVVSDFRFAVERASAGGLVLTGYVSSEAERVRMRDLAADTANGTFVDDRLQTARGLPAGLDGPALIRLAFAVTALLQEGAVRFETDALSVSGNALDAQAVGEIEALIRDQRPTGVTAGRVSLHVLPLTSYRLTIRREAESVTITGHLPDVAARERLLAALRPRFFRERIVDKTRLAQGAPDGLVRALEVAMPSLATLASGELAVNNRNLGLTGESLYTESARRIAATLPQIMPSGWTAQANVQARNPTEHRAAETCRSQFASDAATPRLRFEPGSSALRPEFYPVLDDLAALAKACPDLRITVTGHVDPAPPPNAPKPAAAEAKPPEPAPMTNAALPPAGKAKEQPKSAKNPGKDQAKTAGKSTKPANAAKSEDQPKDEEPPPDLPRLRALVIVEYLLQAGMAPDQITAVAPEPTAARRFDVSFALR
ncbi:hypothetical protein F6X53_02975 [Methylobacterium soli]|uniref:Peptidoglycan-binding protein ArfA BON-like domain-containing protein n=1 Tax=Methylobacterium soli TaxID=553447 RepID=A0A6L3T5H8_9HYPH|nr:hypothetical protein F6X53_02975 [Methylobacterium soli]